MTGPPDDNHSLWPLVGILNTAIEECIGTERRVGSPSCADAAFLELRALAHRVEQLEAALVHSVSVIQGWHNMGMPPKVASDMWDIYWRNAPEMKPLRDALAGGA